MSHSHHSSSGSVSCRLEWRPSRWLICALLLLAILAGLSVLVSEMPRLVAWPLAFCALAYGAWLARSQWKLPHHQFVFPGNELAATCDGQPMEAVSIQWRGPLAFVTWRDRKGRRYRLAWWPDTLLAARRRELRLAVSASNAAPRRREMAP